MNSAMRYIIAACLFCICCTAVLAQEAIKLANLETFQPTGANWQITGDVYTPLQFKDSIIVKAGSGILVNRPTSAAHDNLFTSFQHGDMDVELDYLMAKGSNSGIYLQSRYEIQLFDSWLVMQPHAGDNGGIYERWDDSRPSGSNGYEGYAPRQNASRAPGLWQHLYISFQAPRFDNGKKTANAKFLRVVLNGVLLHENVELTGFTRAGKAGEEVANDALMIQGDHGVVAFRNIRFSNFNGTKPTITGISYAIYKGKYDKEPNLPTLKPFASGKVNSISTDLNGLPNNEFLLRYSGILHVAAAGDYHLNLLAPGSNSRVSINNKTIIPFNSSATEGTINLGTGDWPIDILYSKYYDWVKTGLTLKVDGPGIRTFIISDSKMPLAENDADPVLVQATANTVLRSFVDLPGGTRVVHAVNVGSAGKVHYSYDMDHGTVIQVWRGDFLDATPMWHERGDGSSKPLGAVSYFGDPAFTVAALANVDAPWPTDTTGSGYRPKGYILNDKDEPSFQYLMQGLLVKDALHVSENKEGLQRTITLPPGAVNYYARLTVAKTIEELTPTLYLVGDKLFYIQLDDSGGEKPLLRKSGSSVELIVPVKNQLKYSILF
jgi:Domain of Unknown Function (DUF1080)